MHSTTRDSVPTAAVAGQGPAATDGDVRVVYNAVRTLVPDAGTLRLEDLLPVTRLDPDVAVAAMDRLGREGPVSIHRLDSADGAWLVRRTDR